eukprot:CAMPEP_0174910664 /NCGR_PEP_ID=MMETSP0167-20121228/73449_1 /TAXON_ID=38298 /ORGANISM="Rhodella maculata, Strain CCMP736" /LENGTH=120 /DNA_ID=CAMNT_0016154981 /DNA_START=32 /DNA_END=394 /DNA_ORIENTATION=-
MTEEGLQHFREVQGKENPVLKRYTIRYELGSARLLQGVSMENCALLYPETQGRSLDEIAAKNGPFFPLCWSAEDNDEISENQVSRMRELVVSEFPLAEPKRQEVRASIMAAIMQAKAAAK